MRKERDEEADCGDEIGEENGRDSSKERARERESERRRGEGIQKRLSERDSTETSQRVLLLREIFSVDACRSRPVRTHPPWSRRRGLLFAIAWQAWCGRAVPAVGRQADWAGRPGVVGGGWPARRSGVKEDWHALATRLAEMRPVLVFDNRGMGESDVPNGAYTMDQLASDTLQLASHVGFKAFYLMGISMGGMISQHVAVIAPKGVVRRVILGCTSHGGVFHVFNRGSARAQANAADLP